MTQINDILSIPRIIRATSYAINGLKTILQNQIAFKQEVILSILVIPIGLHFGTTNVERAMLIGCWLLILLMEIINSAIELIVDRISLDIHPLSKKIKDISAAAVLLSIANAIVIWSIILFY